MKLFKEGKGCWAARKHLDDNTDVDVVVQECGNCGRTITTVTFCRSYCQEGIIVDWGFDTSEVIQYRNNAFTGCDRISKGTAKLFCWSGKPDQLQLPGNNNVKLEYEQ